MSSKKEIRVKKHGLVLVTFMPMIIARKKTFGNIKDSENLKTTVRVGEDMRIWVSIMHKFCAFDTPSPFGKILYQCFLTQVVKSISSI